MVKVILPLMSATASGSIRNRLTFSQRKSGSQVRYQRAQKDVITPARTAQRLKFQMFKDWWLLLDDNEKEQWNELTK